MNSALTNMNRKCQKSHRCFNEKQKKFIPLILSNATSQNVISSNFRTNMCQDLIGNDHVRNPIKQNSDLYLL